MCRILIKFLIKIIQNINKSLLCNYHHLFSFVPLIFAFSVSFYFSLPKELNFEFYILAALCFLFSLLGYFYAHKYYYGALIKAVTGFYNISFLAFMLISYESHHLPPFPELPYESIWIEGRIIDQRELPSIHKKGNKEEEIIVKDIHPLSPWYERKTPSLRYVRIRMKEHKKVRVLIGDKIKIHVLFHRRLPSFWVYGRDTQREAYFANMMGNALALSPPLVLQEKRSLWGFPEKWRLFRLSCARKLMKIVPNQEGAVIATLLFGDTENISPQTRKDFSASGLSHLLAVAGLHLGIVMAVVFVALRFFILRFEMIALRIFPYFLASCGALFFGIFYVALTGFHIPALRSLGVAVLFLLGAALKREPISLRLLALIAFILEIFNPVIILDISFQMSFAAVMCILSSLSRRRENLRKNIEEGDVIDMKPPSLLKKVIEYLKTTIRLSTLAALPTIPLTMSYFGAFQPLFLIANIVAIPLMSFWIMPILLLGLLFWTSPLGKFFFILGGKGIKIILWLAHQVTSLPFASYAVPSFPSWGIPLYFLGLAFFCLWKGRERFLGLVIILISCLSPYFIERPVIFVAPYYNLLGVREGHKIFVGAKDNPSISHQWAEDMAASLRKLSEKCPAGEKFCRLDISGKKVLFYLGTNLPEENAAERQKLCKDVKLYISLTVSRPICGAAVPMIDRKKILRDGAWSIYDNGKDGFRLLSDRAVHGEHPWILKQWEQGEVGLPLAKEE